MAKLKGAFNYTDPGCLIIQKSYHIRNRAGKRFEGLKLCCHAHFTVCTCTLLQSKHVVNIMWACSRKVEAVLQAAFVLFLSPVIPNLDRNSNRNNTSEYSL